MTFKQLKVALYADGADKYAMIVELKASGKIIRKGVNKNDKLKICD